MERALGRLVAGAMAAILAACTGGALTTGASPTAPSSTASPDPAPTHRPAPSGEDLAEADLKYRLIDEFGGLWYCDPDQYPVARDDERELAAQHIDEIREDRETFVAIVGHLGLDASNLDTDDQVAIYREWKVLNAVTLDATGSDAFAFDYLAQPSTDGATGTRSTGTIDASGHVDVERQEDAPGPACPICLTRGTLLATPTGPVAVERLSVGDRVWSLDAAGHRINVPILRIGSMRAPEGHEVIRLRLDDGREVTASPSHPLAGGRPLGQVRVGDTVDGARVESITAVAYGDGRTYDVLPAGPTGIYWAADIRLESTLRE